ncbi:MAG: winged helix-turn-helix domain-containing protein [Actinomycetota bacterium]
MSEDRVSFRFGEFVLDPAARELRGADGAIGVERQVFEVLAYLLEHRDRVVPKSELLDTIWGDRFVSESALSSRIKTARQAIGDDGDQQRLIRTARGVGFRFVGPVEELSAAESDETSRRATITAPVEPLIGRDDVVTRLSTELSEHRMVTIVGPGGIGKTHVVRHVAAQIAGSFVHGVSLVDLTAVAEASSVWASIARQVGAPPIAGATTAESVIRQLDGRDLLLIIDNAEHVRGEVSRVCSTVLMSCPDVSIAVTSRERLGVDGEWLLPLGPLSLSDSIELFARRASAHAVDVDRSDATVAGLCRRLDGVPLAIQLAAARTRMLSLDDIAGRLRDHLGGRRLDGDDRHGSMERAVDWSFQSLAATDQRSLGALSILRGEFDLDDATAVIGADAMDTMVRLVEASLVVPVAGATTSRFRVLEPIRLFADSAREAAAVERYVTHFTESAEAASLLAESGDVDRAVATLQRLWPNLRGAVEQALARNDLASVRRVVSAVAVYAELWLQAEVIDWAISAAGGDGPVTAGEIDRAESLAVASRLLAHGGDRDRAAQIVQSMDTVEPTPPIVLARLWSAWYRGDTDGVSEQLERLESQRHAGADGSGLTELSVRALRVFAVSNAGRVEPQANDALRSVARRSGVTGRPFELLADGTEAYWDQRFADALDPFDRAVEAAVDRGQMLFAAGTASFRSIALASMIHDDRVIGRLRSTLGAAVEAGPEPIVVGSFPARTTGRLGNLAVLTDVTVAALALAVRGEHRAASRILAVRAASSYHSRPSELIAAMVVATLTDDGIVEFESESDIGLEEAARIAIAALDELA